MILIMKMELTQSDISSYIDKCFLINIRMLKSVLFDYQTCLFINKQINYIILYDEI